MLQAFEYNAPALCSRRRGCCLCCCDRRLLISGSQFLQSVALFAGEHDVWPHDGRRSRQESNHGCCQLDVCDVKHQNGTRSTHHDGTSGAALASPARAARAGRGRWHGEQSHAAQRRTFRCPRWGGIGRRFRHLLKPALLRGSGRHRRCSGARLDSISARRVCTARFRAIAKCG